MNIVSQFNKIIEENFNKFLKNYYLGSNYWEKTSDINNYYNFMTNLDSFNYSYITNIIKHYLEYIDEVFFNTSYRKNFCESKGFYKRTILTLFGEITYKRRYYYDKKYKDRFYFTDYFLNFPKRKYFDPFICAEICNEAASSSYSKSGKIVASKIGKRINNDFNISRATSRNIVMNFHINDEQTFDNKKIDRLYVMLDEKFVGSQFNEGNDHMIKAAVIFEDTKLVYKTKRKVNSMKRYKLINSHTCASIENKLLSDTLDYIYYNYDTDNLKEINFMGDCALWIKNFPKSQWFKYNENIKINFAMDGFHFSQALLNLTTNEYKNVYDELYNYVLNNDKLGFTTLCNQFLELFPERQEIIEAKRDYILNNWNERQLYQNSPHMRCSMESHISHIFADLFTSRPKSYSKPGLKQLLKLRLLKVNKIDIKQKYLNSLVKFKTINNFQDNSLSNKKNNYDFGKAFIDNYFNKTRDNFINYLI